MNFKFTKTYNIGPFWSDGLGENTESSIEVKQIDQLNGNTDWQYFEINAPTDLESNNFVFEVTD